ncbi:MAG: hypothetical protein AAGN64_09050 [Bacteroidota bacterium]
MTLAAALQRFDAALTAEVEYAVRFHQLAMKAGDVGADDLAAYGVEVRAIAAATEACATERREAALALAALLHQIQP